MRILHTDTDDIENPLRGGQPVRTFEINSRLSGQHQIKVFTATYPGSVDKVKRAGLEYERLGITIPGWGLSSHLSFLARLPRAIQRTPHDLVVEEFTPPFGFCNLQKHTTAPVISIVQWFFFKDWEHRYKLPFESYMRQRAAEYAPRHIIVQTHKMAEQLQSLMPDANLIKIPCGISDATFQPQTVSGEYALYLGRLDIHHKGLDHLLEIWKILLASGMQIPLWIVGAGPDEQALKQQVARQGLSDWVHFKGRLEGEAKKTVLQHCRLMVMPSRQETFGITALEAMASSKPVIAYDVEHLNELVRPPWSVLVPAGNVQHFAREVAQLWCAEQACIEMGQRAYTEARQYRWEVLAKQQEAFYLSVLEQKNL